MAASSRSTATEISNLGFFSAYSFNILLAKSALVPISLQIRGIFRLTDSAASMMPLEMVSHLTMPPKILMRIALTLGCELRI